MACGLLPPPTCAFFLACRDVCCAPPFLRHPRRMRPPAMADGAADQTPSDGDMAPGPPQGSFSLNPTAGSADTSSESGRGGVGDRATHSVQKPRTSGDDLRALASQRARRSSEEGEIALAYCVIAWEFFRLTRKISFSSPLGRPDNV